MTEQLIGQLGYIGIALILILGGFGLPIPEEAPIIVAAVLSRNGQMGVLLAFVSCLAGVIIGDFVVYGLGYFYGEKVLSFRITQRILTRQREAQIKGYFQRHGFKILISGRFVPGFRTAAYLTAGILKLPTLKLFVTDLMAATLSTSAMFGLGYAFAHQIQSGIQEAQRWATVLLAVGVCAWLFWRYYQARQRAGLPVGPPVLDTDDVPLPSDPELEQSSKFLSVEPTREVTDASAAVVDRPGIETSGRPSDSPKDPIAGSRASDLVETLISASPASNPSHATEASSARAAHEANHAARPAALSSARVTTRDGGPGGPPTDGVMLEMDPSASPATID